MSTPQPVREDELREPSFRPIRVVLNMDRPRRGFDNYFPLLSSMEGNGTKLTYKSVWAFPWFVDWVYPIASDEGAAGEFAILDRLLSNADSGTSADASILTVSVTSQDAGTAADAGGVGPAAFTDGFSDGFE